MKSNIFYPVAHRSDDDLAALKNRYTIFDTSFIPKLLAPLGFTPISWEKPASWSTSHVIYSVKVSEQTRPIVIRANVGTSSPETYMVVEKLVTDQVAALGIPVNRILHVDVSRKHFPFDYQIHEALDGSDIEDHFHGARDEYDRLSFELGKFIGMWGSLTFEGYGRFDTTQASRGLLIGTKQSMYDYVIVRLDDDLAYLTDHQLITTENAKALRNVFETHKDILEVKTPTLVQYDLADHNIMFSSGPDGRYRITGIFDWEAAVAGDPVLDLASAPTWRTHFPRQEKLIEGYRSVRDLPDHFQEKMNIYRLRTMLWKMVYAVKTDIVNSQRMQKFRDALAPFELKING